MLTPHLEAFSSHLRASRRVDRRQRVRLDVLLQQRLSDGALAVRLGDELAVLEHHQRGQAVDLLVDCLLMTMVVLMLMMVACVEDVFLSRLLRIWMRCLKRGRETARVGASICAAEQRAALARASRLDTHAHAAQQCYALPSISNQQHHQQPTLYLAMMSGLGVCCTLTTLICSPYSCYTRWMG